MTCVFDGWGRRFRADDPEPARHQPNGVPFCVDWLRRRLTPAGETSTLRALCVHGESLMVWCGECSADLDALSLELLP